MTVVDTAKAFVFDFDGTLVDSNEIKWQGFEHVFAEYPEYMGQIRAYSRTLNHTVRGEKFRHICENILHIPYTPELDRSFHRAYAEFTVRAVAHAPEIPGAERFLKSLKGRPTALLSSTLHESLLETLKLRGWESLFTYVQGAPINKRDWLVKFQATLGCSPGEIVFFGDTDEDAASGAAAGCVFVRVSNGTSFEGLF
jgi:phosphoglycolate phosphatase